jgi:eukaryotic-like serine/threonine-protein kinase
MTPERLQKLQELFDAALDRAPAERASFLAEACGNDDALRRAVESLLVHHGQANSFIESPATVVAADLFADEPRASLVGRSIGRYQVLELLGAGGMGEVYLAQDTSLGRKVALKLLPARFTTEPDRLRRFEQEARTASALNHPNIVTIYEIGQVGETHFIATEYLDGATLRGHLSTMRITAADALDIAVQVSSALAAAHAKGVVHRDIKPENIVVLKGSYSLHRENYVKVLDFGIAKLTETSTRDTEALTKRLIQTNEGVVLGTAMYMSPEQARGIEVDARTDIWSLGVVLYEMLTGKTPFDGVTAEDVRAAILKDRLLPLSTEIPERLKWIVEKALRKDREDRYQTAREFFSDLRELQKQEFTSEALREHSVAPEPGTQHPPSTDQADVAPTSTAPIGTAAVVTPPTSSAEYIVGEIRRHKRGVAIAVVVVLLATVGIAYGLIELWRHSQSSPRLSWQSMKITRLTDTGNATAAAISPDGNYVTYAVEEQGKQSLRLRQVASTSEKEIIAPAEIRFLGITFSRDGNLVYYTAAPKNNARGVLYQVPSLGGTSRRVVENVFGPANLSPDGKSLAFIRTTETNQHTDELIVANADGSGERTLTTRQGQAYLNNSPSWSPDGKTIVCGAAIGPDYLYDSVLEVTVENGTERWITSHKWLNVFRAAWLSDGSGLIVIGRENVPGGSQIWLSSPDGEVRKITNDLNNYLTDEGIQVSLSLTASSGALVVVQEDMSSRIWVSGLNDDENRAHQITNGKSDGWAGVSWTPDKKILSVMRTGNEMDIWSTTTEGEERKQLTSDGFAKGRPAMSPDGRYVAFYSIRSGFYNLWRVDADGGNPKQLTNGGGSFAPQFTPDGQNLIFWSYEWSGFPMLGKVSIDGGEIMQLTNYYAAWPVISPDAKLIAAGHANEHDNSAQLLLIPIEGGPPLKTLNLPDGVVPSTGIEWMRDGKALAYVDTRNGVSNIWSLPIDGRPPKQLTNFQSDRIFRFALSPDGRQLALSRGTQTHDVVLIRDFK